ncbi:MAG: AbrB/MazE/SpoVT family DNA-binding domain-containing protein [Deltaproteobacteria bacterium]|nr:AbrB/MazE/SpoVT family DNA-binding domain-containing protein [Deltaproteobacteria bacterium]
MKCYKDEGEMVPVVIDYEYRGIVVKGVKALRCTVCGEEIIDVDEYGKIRRRIESMLKPLRLRRKISSAGKRPAVYLPDDVVKAVKVEIGDDVDIYVEGNRIIIEPVSSD